MGPPIRSSKDASEGFEGAVAGLGLSDVIQLNGQNRFSGCIAVHYDISTGLVFFRDGEIIHAEQGAHVGEQAFYEIMQWPGGRFSLQPNVATTSHSIKRSMNYLLIEAHRLMDERRSGRTESPSSEPEVEPKRDRAMTVVDRIREIPGVAYAVLLTKDGARLGDESYEGESLEGKTAYLAMLAGRLGQVFGAGEVLAATVQGTDQHLLLLATKQHHLSVLVKGDSQPGAVESEIRKLVATPR
jgi:predicted regulator of Ras-like GTPase activity (Roadblock/LC7/MglB family)